MNTGTPRRAASSQIGSSSGSSMRKTRAVGLADRQPETLGDLADAHRARGDVRVELRDGLLRPAGTDISKVDPGENAHTILHLGRRTHRGQRALQPVARQIVRRNHHADVQAVERRAERRESVGRVDQAVRMAVKVDRGILRRLAPCASRSRASSADDSRGCSAAGTPAPCSCADESRSAPRGTPRPRRSHSRVLRHGHRVRRHRRHRRHHHPEPRPASRRVPHQVPRKRASYACRLLEKSVVRAASPGKNTRSSI